MQDYQSLKTWHVGDNIHGKTYEEWTGEFWKWLTNFPLNQSPGRSDSCDLSQSNPYVFFLEGYLDTDEGPGDPKENERQCISIDSNKSILIAIINKLSTTEENKDKTTNQLLLNQANEVINKVISYSIQIDGQEVKGERAYYPFSLKLENTNNFFGENIKIDTEAASDGYWLFLQPKSLENGRHTIHIQGTGLDFKGNSFTTNVAYELEIS